MDKLTNTDPPDTGQENMELLFESRSPEVQEIVGGMPSWIIRWGATAIAVFLLILIIGANFISYPESKTAAVSIVCSGQPLIIKPPVNATIEKVMVKDNETIRAGQLIAIFTSGTDYSDYVFVNKLARELDTAIDLKNGVGEVDLHKKLSLGNLQGPYQDLLIAVYTYKNSNKETEQMIMLRNKVRKLIDALNAWQDNFLVTSSVSGRVSYLKPIAKGYYASSGEEIIAVVPALSNTAIITGRIKADPASRIKVNQKILIAVDGFASNEYGFLSGTISGISDVNIGGEYLLNIRLSKGLNTTTRHKIPPESRLSGKGSVVVANKSLLQHLLENYISI